MRLFLPDLLSWTFALFFCVSHIVIPNQQSTRSPTDSCGSQGSSGLGDPLCDGSPGGMKEKPESGRRPGLS